MKKIISIILLSLVLNAGEYQVTKLKNQNSIEYKTFKRKFTMNKALKLGILDKYIKNTGASKRSAVIDFKNVYKNEHWKKAMYELYANQKEYQLDTGKKVRKFKFPDFKKILKELSKTVEQIHNPIAAWQGLDIVTNNYMNTGPSEIAKIYTRIFSKELMDRKYCVGYLYYGRSFMKEFGRPNYKTAYKTFKKGKEECINKNIPWFYYHGIRSYKVKSSTMLDLTKGK